MSCFGADTNVTGLKRSN